ncbi:DUF1573 domain-containing protein [bacterium]|nr:DUF1573 domain-containing protein [bacterium]
MKSSIIFPVLLFFSSFAAQAQLRFDALEKDFGDLRPLETRNMEFRVYNDGATTVHLAEPKPSCGCTATILEHSELEPGGSTVIGVRFHASPGMMGPMTKSIAISTLEEGSPKHAATLRIHARVIGDVIYEPGVLRFSTVIGDTVQMQLVLISNTDHDVPLRDITASMLAYVDTSEGNTYRVANVQTRPFTAFHLEKEAEEVRAGDSTIVTLTMIPGEKGQINGSIRIPIPNAELRVPVTGVVLRTRAP